MSKLISLKLIMIWDTCPHHSTQPQPGYPKILNPHLSESLVKGPNLVTPTIIRKKNDKT